MKSKVLFHNLITGIAVMGLFSIIMLSEQSIIKIDDDTLTVWLILCITMMMSILVFNMNRQYAMEKEFVKLRTDLLKRNYSSLSKIYSSNAKLFHDFHNHIDVLYNILKQGKNSDGIKYLEELREPICDIVQNIWTGDDAIDYLINSKIAMAKKEKIQTKVNIEFPRNINIHSASLATILGNLLDNALEANEKVEEKFRFLNLIIRRINNMLIIKVENASIKPPPKDDYNIERAKENNGLHGWGIKNVLEAAEKYEGILQTNYKNHVFTAVVSLSYNQMSLKSKL